IGSSSGIHYRDFLLHLGPIALAGLGLDWLLIQLLCLRGGVVDDVVDLPDPIATVDRARLVKPAVVVALVITGFLAGLPPALVAATGAAVMLVTRSRDPRLVYEEIDWGLLVFFVGLFIIVGGADSAGVTGDLLGVTRRWNLHHVAPFTLVVAMLSNL